MVFDEEGFAIGDLSDVDTNPKGEVMVEIQEFNGSHREWLPKEQVRFLSELGRSTDGLDVALNTLQNNGWTIKRIKFNHSMGFWYVQVYGEIVGPTIVYEITPDGSFNNTFHNWYE